VREDALRAYKRAGPPKSLN